MLRCHSSFSDEKDVYSPTMKCCYTTHIKVQIYFHKHHIKRTHNFKLWLCNRLSHDFHPCHSIHFQILLMWKKYTKVSFMNNPWIIFDQNRQLHGHWVWTRIWQHGHVRRLLCGRRLQSARRQLQLVRWLEEGRTLRTL